MTYSPSATVVAIALLLVVPLLAYFQHKWIGQLSEQEFERTRNTLRSSALRFALEVNQELYGLVKVMGGSVEGSDKEVVDELQNRLTTWRRTSEHSQLVVSITIAPLPDSGQTTRIKFDESADVLLFKNLSAFALPIANRPRVVARVNWDQHYMTAVLIPKLVEAFFVSGTSPEYDLMILDGKKDVFFSSSQIFATDESDDADVVVPFIFIPPLPLSLMPFDRPPRFEVSPGGQQLGLVFTPQNGNRSEPQGIKGDVNQLIPPSGIQAATDYELRIKRRNGSLEEAVNSIRLRNLGISFGILLLLGASVIFLLLSADRAQRLARQQLEFVAGISHELRTPLAVLKSAGENLADGVIHERDRAQQYGELIKSEVVRLSEMVEKALAYAGIQSGKKAYDVSDVDIAKVIDDVLTQAKRNAATQGYVIETNSEPQLPLVRGDADALRSAIENLVANALKYSGKSQWVGVEVKKILVGKERCVEISIRDRGIGIPQEDLRHIFEPFYRASNAVDAQIQGSGLGLSVTQHIIAAHGGNVSVKSSLDKGTEFKIQLPTAHQERENT